MNSQRKKYRAPSKYSESPKFYMRLWYTKTNTYSETLHVNNNVFYKYSLEEKAAFSRGTVLCIRQNNKDIHCVVLSLGTFQAMEALSGHLERFAEEQYDTNTVLGEMKKMAERRQSDTDVDFSDSEESSGNEEISREITKVNEMKAARKRPFSIDRQAGSSGVKMSRYSLERQNCFNHGTVSSTKKTDKTEKSTSHLILAELRVQTTILRNIENYTKDSNQALRFLRGDDVTLPMDDAVFEGNDGPFRLSSLSGVNPNVFARDFLKKTYTKEVLSMKILCPKGRSAREPFSQNEIDNLRTALHSWFGENYNWCLVTASVNQYIRDLKLVLRRHSQ